MRANTEFAEEYTTAERVRFVVLGVLLGGAAIVLSKAVLFPWFQAFVASAPCRKVLGIEGLTVLWYGVLVGFPLLIAVFVGASFGWRGYKILRDGQFPPVNEKVYRQTKIRRGSSAKLIGYLHYCAPAPLLAISIWGALHAAELSTLKEPGTIQCPASHAFSSGAGSPEIKH